jgi:hypothetical protein
MTLGSNLAIAQKILALDVDKPGKVKRIRYQQNDYISLKTINNQFVEGEIAKIEDSSFWVKDQKITLDSIKFIKKTQGGYGWSLIGNISLLAGLGYFSLDATNRIINSDKPIVPRRTLLSSSVFLGIFATTAIINNRKYTINKRRRLKIIDLEIAP